MNLNRSPVGGLNKRSRESPGESQQSKKSKDNADNCDERSGCQSQAESEFEDPPVQNNAVCPKCDSICEANQKALMCYACEIWSHTSCIGMTDQKYKQIQNFGESVDWICKYCRENIYEMRRENQ